ncbi:MAG TPA: MarR family transcriptional regulator [Micromonosporaceae bacterium]|jgi:DNA-binding MarR family transcriptional regulator
MTLGFYIRRLEHVLAAAKTDALRETGLTLPQHTVLLVLTAAPGSFSAAQLARVSLVTPQTMSTIIGNLEAKGLIERTPSPLHAQVLAIKATRAGRDLIRRAEPRTQAVESRLAAAFTEAEQEQFRDFLQRALEVLND